MSWWSNFTSGGSTTGGLSAFDPVGAALSQSSAHCRQRDRQQLIQTTADLIALYKGYQMADVLRDLAFIFTDRKIRERYQKHADTFNLTALIVDRVATLGRDPIKVEWLTAGGEASEADAALWAEIADANEWDGFMQSVGQQLELLSTIVLASEWDEGEARVCLRQYAANVFEVRSSEGEDDRNPDVFRIFVDDGRYQIWDFSGEETEGATPGRKTLRVGYGSGWEIQEETPIEVPLLDPVTGAALVPFVPLRAAYPTDGFWVDKGQEDLLTANRQVNRILTQLAVMRHYGAYQIPVGKGPGWARQRDKELPVVMDVGELFIVPDDPLSGNPSSLEFLGPANEGFFEKLETSLSKQVARAAASRGIDPSFIRVEGGQERSGISLWIGNQALVERQKRVKTYVQQPLKRLVEIIRQTQNAFGERKFSEGATFRITIPDVQFAMEPKDKLAVDKDAVAAGFSRYRDKVREWNPSWTDAEVDAFIAEREAKQAPPPAPAAPSLFGPRRPAVPGNPPPGPVPPAPPTRG